MRARLRPGGARPIPMGMRFLLPVVGVFMFTSHLHAQVRPPAVADSFYPGTKEELERAVRGFLATPQGQAPVAVIAPHAGYVFSGATAGKAFAPLAGGTVKRVILLGPSHYVGFRGGALPAPGATAFATPLGEMPLDRAALAQLARLPEFSGPAAAHEREHCLEVELPFLQATLGAVPIVPVLIGGNTDLSTATALARRLADLVGPGTIVVVSSDFTHHGASYGYSPFGSGPEVGPKLLRLGRATAERAAAMDARGFAQQVEVAGDTVCGAAPITVLLELLAHAFDGSGRVVEVTTSADVSANWSQVVTYAGVDFVGAWRPWREDEPAPHLGELNQVEKKAALALARATLETYLTHEGQLALWHAGNRVAGNLRADAGVFVTINNVGAKAKAEGKLRGCIGVMEAREPLADAIVSSAISAARDPRFPPLETSELSGVGLEISVLSPMRRVSGPDAITLGKHGVLLSKGGRHAVFLPQVATETGWDLPTFLSQLSLKAGMSPDAWKAGATFEVFTAQVFGETE